jgi:hypothetical protein
LLYESDRNIISWYYEVYAQSFASGDINAIASGIFGREVRGPMTLVKNGPTSSAFSFAVDRGAVAKVLWYYYASAVDPTIVAAERAFERMLVG